MKNFSFHVQLDDENQNPQQNNDYYLQQDQSQLQQYQNCQADILQSFQPIDKNQFKASENLDFFRDYQNLMNRKRNQIIKQQKSLFEESVEQNQQEIKDFQEVLKKNKNLHQLQVRVSDSWQFDPIMNDQTQNMANKINTYKQLLSEMIKHIVQNINDLVTENIDHQVKQKLSKHSLAIYKVIRNSDELVEDLKTLFEQLDLEVQQIEQKLKQKKVQNQNKKQDFQMNEQQQNQYLKNFYSLQVQGSKQNQNTKQNANLNAHRYYKKRYQNQKETVKENKVKQKKHNSLDLRNQKQEVDTKLHLDDNFMKQFQKKPLLSSFIQYPQKLYESKESKSRSIVAEDKISNYDYKSNQNNNKCQKDSLVNKISENIQCNQNKENEFLLNYEEDQEQQIQTDRLINHQIEFKVNKEPVNISQQIIRKNINFDHKVQMEPQQPQRTRSRWDIEQKTQLQVDKQVVREQQIKPKQQVQIRPKSVGNNQKVNEYMIQDSMDQKENHSNNNSRVLLKKDSLDDLCFQFQYNQKQQLNRNVKVKLDLSQVKETNDKKQGSAMELSDLKNERFKKKSNNVFIKQFEMFKEIKTQDQNSTQKQIDQLKQKILSRKQKY